MKQVKRIIFLLLSSICIICSDRQFSIVTWNILGVWAPDLESYQYSGSQYSFRNNDFSRFYSTIKILNSCNTDVVCLQEVLESMALSKNPAFIDFNKQLRYQMVSYQKKGTTGGVALYVNPTGRLSFLKSGTIDMSSMQGGACAWGLFEVKLDPVRKVLVCSVHLNRDNELSGLLKGRQQWDMIIAEISKIIKIHSPCSLVIAGDFNTLYEEVFRDSQSYIGQSLDVPIEMYEHKSWTANGNINFDFKNPKASLSAFGGAENYVFSSLDHVLYSSQSLTLDRDLSKVGVLNYDYVDEKVLTSRNKVNYSDIIYKYPIYLIHQIYPSDHIPVKVVFDFKNDEQKVSSKVHKGQKLDSIMQRDMLIKALELANLLH